MDSYIFSLIKCPEIMPDQCKIACSTPDSSTYCNGMCLSVTVLAEEQKRHYTLESKRHENIQQFKGAYLFYL